MDNYLSRLDKRLFGLIKRISLLADRYKVSAYLAGGVVRDMFLGRDNFDFDVVIEGDAVFLARRLAVEIKAAVVVHQKFGTAVIEAEGLGRIDFAAARKEYYPHPGELPVVRPGRIRDDLFRRDFTINAMAVAINGAGYGRLIDLFGGLDDLHAGKIRVLHEKSFIDDPTRIARAVRFEQRFSFRIERKTLSLLKTELAVNRDDKIRHRYFVELKKLLKEPNPPKCLKRLYYLGWLRFLDNNFCLDVRHFNRIHKNFISYRNRYNSKIDSPVLEMPLVYFIAMFEPVADDVFSSIRNRFHFTREEKKALLQSRQSLDIIKRLSVPGLSPSRVYKMLSCLHIAVVIYLRLKVSSRLVLGYIDRFLKRDRFICLQIKGSDIEKMGTVSGRQVGRILDEILYQKIDGILHSKRDEINAARQMFKVRQ